MARPTRDSDLVSRPVGFWVERGASEDLFEAMPRPIRDSDLVPSPHRFLGAEAGVRGAF